jgi:hypothetical protein
LDESFFTHRFDLTTKLKLPMGNLRLAYGHFVGTTSELQREEFKHTSKAPMAVNRAGMGMGGGYGHGKTFVFLRVRRPIFEQLGKLNYCSDVP